MSTIRANAIVDASGGNTATINGITPALASQAQAEAGTDNATLMTPLQAENHMIANVIGWGQTWQQVTGSRAVATSYQNTTGRPIMVSWLGGSSAVLQVSTDNSTWISTGGASTTLGAAIIPNNNYYRWNTGSLSVVAELR